MVLVGDRGMITQARLTEDVKAAGPSVLTTIDPALLIGIDPLTCFLPAPSG
jgi:hypothetical protein